MWMSLLKIKCYHLHRLGLCVRVIKMDFDFQTIKHSIWINEQFHLLDIISGQISVNAWDSVSALGWIFFSVVLTKRKYFRKRLLNFYQNPVAYTNRKHRGNMKIPIRKIFDANSICLKKYDTRNIPSLSHCFFPLVFFSVRRIFILSIFISTRSFVSFTISFTTHDPITFRLFIIYVLFFFCVSLSLIQFSVAPVLYSHPSAKVIIFYLFNI